MPKIINKLLKLCILCLFMKSFKKYKGGVLGDSVTNASDQQINEILHCNTLYRINIECVLHR